MPDGHTTDQLIDEIRACRICAERFAKTATAHQPRPVAWFSPTAKILIAGQAPGARVHESGKPFTDASGDRLRDWLGLSEPEFYDKSRIAIVPMAFCFPGYTDKGADLPPPAICATQWRDRVLRNLPRVKMILAVGASAQLWHMKTRNMTQAVGAWRDYREKLGVWPLPHPSWRNTGWIKTHPWFTRELLPDLRDAVRTEMEGPQDD